MLLKSTRSRTGDSVCVHESTVLMGVTAQGRIESHNVSPFLLIFQGLVCYINRDIETVEPEGLSLCTIRRNVSPKDLKIS